jgi:Na+/H+-translocating membrane pyrophosphatase
MNPHTHGYARLHTQVWIGGLLGSMLVFLFSSYACAAVGRSAQAVVNEVTSLT